MATKKSRTSRAPSVTLEGTTERFIQRRVREEDRSKEGPTGSARSLQ